MRRTRRDDVSNPIVKERGETVHELIGAREEIGGTAHHSVAETVIRPGGSSARHRHVRSEETYYVLHGVARLVIDNTEFRLSAGDACLIEPGENHQIFNESQEDALVFLAVSAPPWIASDSVFD
jgi:mannose-6-phosphate isomerase-like protein (cupin superfamily)